jgi:hypothetical protein
MRAVQTIPSRTAATTAMPIAMLAAENILDLRRRLTVDRLHTTRGCVQST